MAATVKTNWKTHLRLFDVSGSKPPCSLCCLTMLWSRQRNMPENLKCFNMSGSRPRFLRVFKRFCGRGSEQTPENPRCFSVYGSKPYLFVVFEILWPIPSHLKTFLGNCRLQKGGRGQPWASAIWHHSFKRSDCKCFGGWTP